MSIKNFAVYFLFAVLLSAGFSEVRSQTLRIMPLGNSITAGNMCVNGTIHSCTPIGGHIAVGYRLRLLNLLTASGYNIDFVGTETYGNALMSDSDCAGFGGISDGNLANVMETGTSSHTGWKSSGPYMNSNPADVVLLHIGTNDILAADTANNDVDRILDAIDDYETSHGTNVMVFLARIISTRGDPCNTNPRVKAYNRMMDDLAATRRANGDQLILVDMECAAGLDYNNDMMDEVHPNQDGYDKMGKAWYDAITAWMAPPGNTYMLSMVAPMGNGNVSPTVGTHSYAEGTAVSISASPATGYEFSSWTGDLESTENPALLTMNGNKSIQALFSKLRYELTLSTDGSPGAALSPLGSIFVDHGAATTIEVTSIPEGYSFNGWELVSGSSVSIEDPLALSTTVTLESGDARLQANFIPHTHSLTVQVMGEGSVEPDPDQETYSHNSMVNLTAHAASGYEFTAWTGDLEGNSNPVSLNMDGDKNVTATFALNPYTLTVLTDGTEGVELSPEGNVFVEHGLAISIEVRTIPGDYNFDSWVLVKGSSVRIGDTSLPSTTVSLESGDATIRANFKRKVQVLGVNIPNETHIIADTVEADIHVMDDQGSRYELVSGMIGDYALENLQRIDSSLYVASFIVFEGGSSFQADEDIPVAKLVIGDDQASSAPFATLISQDSDPIDASAPKILSMSVPSMVFLVGDTIEMTIVADGDFYLTHEGSSINGVSMESDRLEFSEKGGGEYRLIYVVGAEDQDVASGELEAHMLLRDGPGNLGSPFTEIQENTLVIKRATDVGLEYTESEPTLFPNPAGDYLEFDLRAETWQGSRIEIVDLSGRTKISLYASFGQKHFRLDISQLETGAYLVRMVNSEGAIWTDKVMKSY